MGKKQDDKRFEEYSKGRVVCNCGHTMFLSHQTDKTICSWCGHWVYRNEKVKFKHQLLNMMKTQKKENI